MKKFQTVKLDEKVPETVQVAKGNRQVAKGNKVGNAHLRIVLRDTAREVLKRIKDDLVKLFNEEATDEFWKERVEKAKSRLEVAYGHLEEAQDAYLEATGVDIDADPKEWVRYGVDPQEWERQGAYLMEQARLKGALPANTEKGQYDENADEIMEKSKSDPVTADESDIDDLLMTSEDEAEKIEKIGNKKCYRCQQKHHKCQPVVKNKLPRTCYRCQEPGHFARNCMISIKQVLGHVIDVRDLGILLKTAKQSLERIRKIIEKRDLEE